MTDTLDAIAREKFAHTLSRMLLRRERTGAVTDRGQRFVKAERDALKAAITALSNQGEGAVVPPREPDAWWVSRGLQVELIRRRDQAEQLMKSGAWSVYPMYIGPQPTAEADRRDAERYRWLRSRLLCADFDYGQGVDACSVIVFEWPGGARISANLDESIDAATQGANLMAADRVTDEMLQAAMEAYADTYEAEYHASGAATTNHGPAMRAALTAALRAQSLSESPIQQAGCICSGNWRAIVSESEPLFGSKYNDRDGNVWTFFGVVHGSDDYYYGMCSKGRTVLLSCAGSIEGHGYTPVVIPNPPQEASE